MSQPDLPAILPRASMVTATRMRLALAVVAILLTAWTQWFAPQSGSVAADEWLRDSFIRLSASHEPERRVVLVDIDEASLSAVGPWPWPRARIADLIEQLVGTYGARGVALDLVFPDRADDDGDLRLAMLAQHGPVVLAQALDYVDDRAAPLRVGTLAAGRSAAGVTGLPHATGYLANHAGLAVAPHVGNIGFVPDADGTIRRLPMDTRFDGRLYPTLSKVLLECCDRRAAADATPAAMTAAAPAAAAPAGMTRVPFARDWDAYTVVSAGDLLAQRAPREEIAGRLVIVGSSALGLTDRVATPLLAGTPGMLVHASMLSAQLDAQAGQAPARWPGRWIALLFSVVVAGATAFAFPRLQAVLNVALLAGASLAWLGLAWAICPHDPDLVSTGPLLSNLFLLAVAVPFDWQLAQRKSRQLLGTLRQYVADAVVDELLARDLKDPLTPRRLNVTTLIADMEGYTTQVEALSMEESAQLTTDFLACLTKPVLDHHGTLDKFTGDGLVAFWGAPLPVDDHADQAIDAAAEIVRAVARFSERRIAEGKKPLRVRVGIESGVAMAGDFGTSSRSIYTAVGDSVNVASRLEQMAREFPHDIIIGQGAVERSTRHRFLLLGERLLRGREKPITLYTLAPEKTA